MNNVCTSNLSMGESFDDYDDDAFAKILKKIENGKIFFLVYLNMSEKKWNQPYACATLANWPQ